MGKILISDDHKLKLEKVLLSKSGEDVTTQPVGPAPKLQTETIDRNNNIEKKEEKKNIFLENINYLKFSKLVFLTSVLSGIGLTLGVKIGIIIFY